MLRSKNIDRICCLVIACTMLLAAGFTALAGAGVLESSRKTSLTYAKHLFDQSTVHKIEITMDGWDDFIDNCTDTASVTASSQFSTYNRCINT